MHIYRLAMELGFLEAKYEDRRARELDVSEKTQWETAFLQSLPRDSEQWGEWDGRIHQSGIQKNRQYRAYFIWTDEAEGVRKVESRWVIHGYNVTLQTCECEDFRDRFLPCKHIYSAALISGIPLPLSQDEFIAAKNQGLENVFRYEDTLGENLKT